MTVYENLCGMRDDLKEILKGRVQKNRGYFQRELAKVEAQILNIELTDKRLQEIRKQVI